MITTFDSSISALVFSENGFNGANVGYPAIFPGAFSCKSIALFLSNWESTSIKFFIHIYSLFFEQSYDLHRDTVSNYITPWFVKVIFPKYCSVFFWWKKVKPILKIDEVWRRHNAWRVPIRDFSLVAVFCECFRAVCRTAVRKRYFCPISMDERGMCRDGGGISRGNFMPVIRRWFSWQIHPAWRFFHGIHGRTRAGFSAW